MAGLPTHTWHGPSLGILSWVKPPTHTLKKKSKLKIELRVAGSQSFEDCISEAAAPTADARWL